MFNGLIKGRFFAVILFLFCISVYFNSLSCKFVYDDNYLIVNNPYIKNLHSMRQIFSECLYKSTCEFSKPDYYRPLQAISFMLDYRLWRLNPAGYHLTNLFIHFLNSLLIYYVIYLVFKNLFIAVVSSFLFCIHPINITAVTYISGRADLLSALFTLLVFLCTILSLKNHEGHKSYFFLIILFSVLALFSRENALFIPLGIFLLSIFIEGDKRYKIELLFSTSLIVGLYLLFRIKLLNMPILGYPSIDLKPYLKIINFLYAIISYISLLVIPKNLHLMHTIPPILSPQDPRMWVTLGSFVFLITLFYAKRKNKIFAFSIIWFFIFIIQASLLMAKFSKNQLSIREHWIYLSSVGFYIIISYLLYYLKRYIRVYIYFLIGIIFLIYGILTIINNANFRDELILSKYLLGFEPDNIQVHSSLISIYLEKKEFDKAFWHIEQATEIDPLDPDLYFSKGRYYDYIGNTEMAIFYYERLLKIAPNSGRTHNNLGAIYFDMGNYDKAEMFFRKAMALSPLPSEPYLNMAILSYKKNNINDAIFFYKQAIRLNPDTKGAFIGLAKLYIEYKRFKEALDLLNNALTFGHEDSSILMMLGMVNDKLGFDNKALYYLKKALKIDPESQEVMLSIGIFYANHNQIDKAIEIWKEAININPNNEIIKVNIKKAEELQNKK